VARKKPSLTYHIEAGAEGGHAFFIFGLGAINRIEIVSIGFTEVTFKVVYPNQSYLFGFSFGRPCIYRSAERVKIRLSAETYRELYRLADVFMHAMLAGVQERYQIKGKGFHWLNGGERFKICSLRQSEFVVEVEKVRYTFVREWILGEEVICMKGSDRDIPEPLRLFLHRFAPLVLNAYVPYQRVEGDQLDPLALFPDLEKEPPRKVRQQPQRRKQKELNRMGKPSESKPMPRLSPPVSGNLFELRTLPK